MLYPRARLGPDEKQILYDGPPDGLATADDPRVRQFVEGEARDRLTEQKDTHDRRGVASEHRAAGDVRARQGSDVPQASSDVRLCVWPALLPHLGVVCGNGRLLPESETGSRCVV